jgi:hypothetical protein
MNRSNRSNRAQKRILLLVALFFVGVVVYLKAMARSVHKEVTQMQTADEQFHHSPKREASAQRVETQRRLLQAILQDDAPQFAPFLKQGVTGKTIVNQKPVCNLAASNGAIHVMSLLLAQGTDINAHDRNGETLLMKAAENKKTAMVDFLLAHGADINATDKNGATAISRAVVYNPSYQSEGSQNNQLAMIEKKFQDSELAVMQSLIKHGASVNVHPRGNLSSPMESAVGNSNVDILRLLLSHGGDPNEQVKGNGSLLHYARQFKNKKGNAEIVQALIQAGAKE